METELAEVAAVEVAVWEEEDRRHKCARFGKFLSSCVRVLFSYILKRDKMAGKMSRTSLTLRIVALRMQNSAQKGETGVITTEEMAE